MGLLRHLTCFKPYFYRIRCRGSTAVGPIAQILEMADLAPDLIKRLACRVAMQYNTNQNYFTVRCASNSL